MVLMNIWSMRHGVALQSRWSTPAKTFSCSSVALSKWYGSYDQKERRVNNRQDNRTQKQQPHTEYLKPKRYKAFQPLQTVYHGKYNDDRRKRNITESYETTQPFIRERRGADEIIKDHSRVANASLNKMLIQHKLREDAARAAEMVKIQRKNIQLGKALQNLESVAEKNITKKTKRTLVTKEQNMTHDNVEQLDKKSSVDAHLKSLDMRLHRNQQKRMVPPPEIAAKTKAEQSVFSKELLQLFENENLNIQKRVKQCQPQADLPLMKTWNSLLKLELDRSMLNEPKNGLEEMITWTKEGKMWHFPIDNEQGMEEEQDVHFSQHVFLDHHLEEWCPTQGPIRHYMELVCIGLSKNPYLTVEEKIAHIAWYKNYFTQRADLMEGLGVWNIDPVQQIDENKPVPETAKQ